MASNANPAEERGQMSDSSIIALEQDMAGATAIHTARMIGDTLEAHYPGWMWYVEVNQGVATIKSTNADPKYGYRLNLAQDFYSASELSKMTVRAGGELLERLGMPRRRADYEAMQGRPATPHGFLKYAN